jgi:hypothetical protein
MHLIIATRDDPHLHLPRLRAQGQLTELRGAELRFMSSEVAEFLNRVMGLDSFGIGEHYRKEFLDSAPAIILAAAAVREFVEIEEVTL